MMRMTGQFQYESKPLPPEPEDWWPARVLADMTASLENHADFPQRLCPDAWKWYRGVRYDLLPLEVTVVPRGSWLIARLASLAGGSDELQAVLHRQLKATGEGEEFSLPLSVQTPTGDEQIAVVQLVFDAEQVRVEGFALPVFAKAIDDDLLNILCPHALTSLVECRFELDGQPLGYDGEHFYGERVETSRFEEIVAEEKRVAELAQQNIELAPGDDGPATNAALLRHMAEYLRNETRDGQFIADNLQYLRSAKIDETYYLIWEYIEADGRRCYTTFAHAPTGDVMSYTDAGHLTPEQYIFADYQQFF